ncbi:hypothetical protein GCM10010910_08510 [Microbacterium nanhaiense]|uniref:DUF3592 domain-containing protein n=1 Tax=Microbacterium nanhaiense TaxID=1301026 RepID=A0ABQ2MXV5_9MICO|nr:hypothetical protein [Microbacterium nanhaiense]GGO61221.1 hypothetical protein GCM10010910_08510 [Microbacterium nanhaiense]
MNILDTLIWLVNFPATHAYEMVFLGAFSSFGLIGLALRKGPRRSRLAELRAERGQAPTDVPAAARIAAALQSWFFRLLSLVVLSGLAIAIASLVFGPITRAYIHNNGEQALATQTDGLSNAVQFVAEDGETYTLSLPFFSPPTYPDRDAFISSGGQLVVRYLPGHPQAYVVDTSESVDSWGEPIGE